MNLLEVKNLSINYRTEGRLVQAVTDLNLTIRQGETLGLVGETGAGKTTTALGIMRIVADPPGSIDAGEILFEGENLLDYSASEMRKVRGNKISMIFQDPMTALNPVIKVGEQIAEVIRLHEKGTVGDAMRKALDLLQIVGIPPERAADYPHQFSGGMKQRVVIAIALACSPQLLIADEPTTALDVTIQAQVLDMMKSLKTVNNTSMLLITHDLGVVAECCDRVAIMYAGQIVESGSLEDIFDHCRHPYTKGLFGSLPGRSRSVRLTPIPGLMPDPAKLPAGCRFHPRCPLAQEKCKDHVPVEQEVSAGHCVRCLFADSIPAGREGI